MSALWTAHLRRGADPARTVFVGDGWRWGAFLFGPLWALWNGCWLAALALVGAGAAVAALAAAGQPETAAAAELALRVALGWEGGALLRLDRRLRGWREVGAVPADTEAEAERRWFAAAPHPTPAGAAP